MPDDKLKKIDPKKLAVPKHPSPAVAPPARPPGKAVVSSPETSKGSARPHPLRRFSLRGKADELEARAAHTKPLLGSFIMDGQATMIYAAPNTGKTLILLHLLLAAIENRLVEADRVYYVNADDGSQGLAVKTRLLQDVGAHMLAPGAMNLKVRQVVEMMIQAVEEGSARGTVIIIDTLKKFTNPMDKKESSHFGQVCRQYVMAGGTIIALGHTRKNPKADGTAQYQGTTDILEDFDAVYIAQLLKPKSDGGQRVVQFNMEKKRADSPDAVAYAYAADPGISYEEKLVSVRPVDPGDLDDYVLETFSDPEVITAIAKLIEVGEGEGQMLLVKKAARAAIVSERIVLRVLQELTGTVPGKHLWNYHTGPRNVRRYEFIPQK